MDLPQQSGHLSLVPPLTKKPEVIDWSSTPYQQILDAVRLESRGRDLEGIERAEGIGVDQVLALIREMTQKGFHYVEAGDGFSGLRTNNEVVNRALAKTPMPWAFAEDIEPAVRGGYGKWLAVSISDDPEDQDRFSAMPALLVASPSKGVELQNQRTRHAPGPWVFTKYAEDIWRVSDELFNLVEADPVGTAFVTGGVSELNELLELLERKGFGCLAFDRSADFEFTGDPSLDAHLNGVLVNVSPFQVPIPHDGGDFRTVYSISWFPGETEGQDDFRVKKGFMRWIAGAWMLDRDLRDGEGFGKFLVDYRPAY